MVYTTKNESFPQLDIGALIPPFQEGVSRKYLGYYSEVDITKIVEVLNRAKRPLFSNLVEVVRLFDQHKGAGGKVLYLETKKTKTKISTRLKASDLVIAVEQ